MERHSADPSDQSRSPDLHLSGLHFRAETFLEFGGDKKPSMLGLMLALRHSRNNPIIDFLSDESLPNPCDANWRRKATRSCKPPKRGSRQRCSAADLVESEEAVVLQFHERHSWSETKVREAGDRARPIEVAAEWHVVDEHELMILIFLANGRWKVD